METKNAWIIFAIGAIAGATVALVCAPQSGTKTRKQIGSKLRDASESLQDQIEDAGGYVRKQASVLGDQAGKVYKRGKESVAGVSDDLVDNLQAAVQSVKGSVS